MSTPQLSPAEAAQDRGPYVIASVTPCLVLAIIATTLRLMARRLQRVKLNASDYLAVAATVSAICEASMIYEGIHYGFAKHVELLNSSQLETFLQIFFAAEIFYVTTISLAKFSILYLYTSLFPGKHFALFAYLIGSFVLAWATACIFGVIFSCIPVQGFWDLSLKAKCIDSTKFFIGNAIPNMFSDAVILILPMKKIWALQMSTRHKLAVSGMFLLGGFVTVASILRLVLLFNENLADPTYGLVNAFTWSNIEVDVAVISCSLPTLRPVFQHLWPSQFTTRMGTSSKASALRQLNEDNGISMASMGRKPGTHGTFYTLGDDGADDGSDDAHGYSATASAARNNALTTHSGIHVSHGVEQHHGYTGSKV